MSLEEPGNALDRLVRARREGLGLSQADLARRAGLSQAAVSGLEVGRTRPHLSSIERLRAVLGDADEALLAAAGVSAAERQAAAARGALGRRSSLDRLNGRCSGSSSTSTTTRKRSSWRR
jgi:transcriptional regulator with XRE-family HTH domain